MVSVSSRSDVSRTGKMLMLVDPLPLRFVARTKDFSSFAVVAFLNTSEVTYLVQVGHLSVAGKRHRR